MHIYDFLYWGGFAQDMHFTRWYEPFDHAVSQKVIILYDIFSQKYLIFIDLMKQYVPCVSIKSI